MKIDPKIKNSAQNILIIQTAFIGDVILITPLIAAVNKLFPKAKIDVMVIPDTSGILENNPRVNNIIKFDKRKNKFFSFLKTLKTLKNNKYDIALTPHSSMTTAFLMFLAKIKIRVGFARWAARNLLTHKIPHLKNVHKIEKNLYLISPFTDEKFSIQTELFPTTEMQNKAADIISTFDKSVIKIIAIAPGSNWFTKKWPKEYYERLVDKLSNKNFGIIFIGSKQEQQLCEDIKPEKNSINLAGGLSLLESAAVIKLCNLMICNDSGALHLANAMQTDVMAFFGPTVKKIGYYPFRENDKVLEVDLDCRPCSSHGTNTCPLEHHNCMYLIEPDFVASEVLRKFEV